MKDLINIRVQVHRNTTQQEVKSATFVEIQADEITDVSSPTRCLCEIYRQERRCAGTFVLMYA